VGGPVVEGRERAGAAASGRRWRSACFRHVWMVGLSVHGSPFSNRCLRSATRRYRRKTTRPKTNLESHHSPPVFRG
jgi:hypothetical protein